MAMFTPIRSVCFWVVLLAAGVGVRMRAETPPPVDHAAVAAVGETDVAGDVFLAQYALRDGLFGLARQRALRVLGRSDADPASQAAAFQVLMLVYEQEMPPETVLALFDAGASEGVIWPSGVESVDAWRTYWQARAEIRDSRHASARQRLQTLREETRVPEALSQPLRRLLAFACVAAGEPDAALAIYESEPDAPPDWTLDHARTLLAAGRTEAAIERLEALAAETNAVAVSATATLLVAEALGDAGREAAAREVLLACLDRPGLTADYRALAMASLALQDGKDPDAPTRLDWAERAVQTALAPWVQEEVLRVRVRVLAEAGPPEAVGPATRLLVARAPRSARVGAAILHVADVLLARGELVAALDEYDLYVSAFDDPAGLHGAQMGRGAALLRLDRPAEAATAYLRAADLAGIAADHERALLLAAEAQHVAELDLQALTTITRLLARSPEPEMQARARLIEAECRTALDPAVGLTAFKALAEAFPDTDHAQMALFRAAQLYADRAISDGDAAAAQAAIDHYVRAAQTTRPALKASAIIGSGAMRLHTGDGLAALADFDRVSNMAAIGPARDQARYMRAEALLALDRADDAVAAARELLSEDTDAYWRREACFWMGRRRFNDERFEEAEHFFTRYVTAWPDGEREAIARLFQAQSRFYLHAYRAAIDAAVELVSRSPDEATTALARFIHAEALAELLQFDAAVLLYDVVARTAQADTLRLTALARRGDGLFTLGTDHSARYEESLAAYQSVLADPAPKPLAMELQCQYKIGRCLEKMGRAEAALKQYYEHVVIPFETQAQPSAQGVDPGARIWYVRAVMAMADDYERRERWAEALSMLQKIVDRRAPGAEEAARRMARIKTERVDPATRHGFKKAD